MFDLLKPNEIHVYYILVSDLPDEILIPLLRILSRDELETYHRYRFRINKQEFLWGRYLAKHILANHLGTKASAIYFSKNDYGKPYLSEQYQGKEQIQFNISHSGGIVAVALALGFEVGIDIEKVDRPITDIIERFFTENEQAFIWSHNPDEQKKVAYKLWTLKEAYIKALGKGLSISLNSFDVLQATKEAHFFTFQPRPDYFLSVTTQPGKTNFRSIITEINISDSKQINDSVRDCLLHQVGGIDHQVKEYKDESNTFSTLPSSKTNLV